ncbi:hypothetical protein DPMN_172162 [Dreissena polymorpha]|uniref:Beta-N-acetylhexosaminidase n=1 Tax=Dreissena polymorpha TaxID=45954 RepID=A0A9D4E2L0_DREPO|nr:hypothetical protein DPMN_172162 [Dreissena polymorpha]
MNKKAYSVPGLKNYFVSRLAKMASERGLKLAGWEDGFWDGYDPLPVEDLNRQGEVYVNPWNNIWEWGSGSNAYKYANAGYKVLHFFV